MSLRECLKQDMWHLSLNNNSDALYLESLEENIDVHMCSLFL